MATASHPAVPGQVTDIGTGSLSLAREPDAPAAPTPAPGLSTAATALGTAIAGALAKPDGPRHLPPWLSLLLTLATGAGGVGIGAASADAWGDGSSEVAALRSEVAILRTDVASSRESAAPKVETAERFTAIETAMVDAEIRSVLVFQVLLDGQDQLLDAEGIPDEERARLPPEIERDHDEILALAGARRRFGRPPSKAGSVPP